MNGLSIEGVSKVFATGKKEQFVALDRVSLTIQQGEFFALLGPSGCGKSTLLHILAGLSEPSQGCVLWQGHKIQGPGLDRGVVFQTYSLFPWMTAEDNLLFALKQKERKGARRDHQERVRHILDQVGLSGSEKKYPIQLSGGQQQRVAIARALLLEAPLLLLDEPFGALDAISRAQLQELLLRLWQEKKPKPTVIMVTHDLDEAIYLSDRIAVLAANPGRITELIAIPWARPRKRNELLSNPELLDIRARLLSLLQGEDVSGQQGRVAGW
ncbi:ABC transporter ATP-binding protein [Aneurinibacillus danicus]|jgi:NitT/TauT family transport system ATP-binding protein|uniref:ABC transporter ATP-binding protein n=1 Tax=Aneurinibacillus danicus TaxID=267746 RepID=A0A511V3L4_9BACL|nr:ABC transporter ATP-binding protein [Aneurinibacillus danicus]GEN33517.1 ABC transporter ATP-binding protein [Aneurinibacillus danicus]